MRLLVAGALVVLVACGGGSNPSAPTEPVVPVPPPLETVLIGAGDIGWNKSDVQRYTGELVQASVDREGAIPFTAGDDAYPDGSYADFMTNYHPFWGTFREKTLAVLGNHEYHTKNAAGFFKYFGDAGDPDHTGTGWYAKSLPTVFVVVLNSNVNMKTNSPQLKWLRSVVKLNTMRCAMAIWHHPRWSSGKNGDTSDTTEFVYELYLAGFDVVVSAHDHGYERFAPQDYNGKADPVRGIRQFVAAGGGADLYDMKERKANSEVRLKSYGVLNLRFREAGYRWEYRGLDGKALDTRPGDPSEFEQCH